MDGAMTSEQPTFAPFFRIAGTGYAIDEKGTPEYRQMKHGWQSEWTMDDEPTESHALSSNPVVMYDVPENSRNAADVIAACERALDGERVVRAFVPPGRDFAFVTFARDEGAKALCDRGVAFDYGRGNAIACACAPARVPGPAVVRWRDELRASAST